MTTSKRLRGKNIFQKAFTLIEILLVISIMGILAAGAFTVLDPIEMINRASDANRREATIAWHDAVNRFYASHQYMPWCTPTGCNPLASGLNLGTANVTAYNFPVTAVINSGELKSNFLTNLGGGASNVFLYGDTSATAATSQTACFLPISKSLNADPLTKYNVDGTIVPITAVAATTCKNETTTGGARGTKQCYYCIID